MKTIDDLKTAVASATSGFMPTPQQVRNALTTAVTVIELQQDQIFELTRQVANIQQCWGSANLKEVAA